ncbi:GNAT family N-acetyltransferase [Mangrovivirga sp. M17]|uniref:GNAT family N-acetyltransferase n=1 Tax=Mangrovivirga halotolerans TaxID=2993936 RepID=A0ABT3RUW3_9BACT|nr:GNAT family N-acetyltransferase [Mangrovivirga halotolerans]MCX2745571.1 GNAT family N-acetyltransferase [Mangrovivirga halotolerans]
MTAKNKFPVLKTDRLILSKPLVSDVPDIVRQANNKKIEAFTLNIPHPYSEDDAVSWLNMINQGWNEGSQVTFKVSTKTDKEFIGAIGLKINKRFNHAELGYWLGEDFWGAGFITEAIGAILNYGFNQLNLHKIHAHYMEGNPASGKVMEKNGMIREAELKDHVKKDGKYLSIIQYRLTQEEYKSIIK